MEEIKTDTDVMENVSSTENEPKTSRRKNIMTGILAAGTLAAIFFGTYLLNRHPSEHDKVFTPIRTEIAAPIEKETKITATRTLIDTIYAKKGDTAWDIIRDNYRLDDNSAIAQKVNEIAELNYKTNPEQPKAMVDNRSVIGGKLVNDPDGIRFDHLFADRRILLPKNQKDDITINYFKDEKGNLYDENLRPITYNDLKEIVRAKLKMNGTVTYDIDPKSDPIITTILTSLDGKKERLNDLFRVVDNNLENMTAPSITKQDLLQGNIVTNIATIVDENSNVFGAGNDPHNDAYLNSWNDYMGGKYSYAKLKSSKDKDGLMAYLVDTYKNHTVKDAALILGMSRYQLYKTLDMEFGKGVMRKRPYIRVAA